MITSNRDRCSECGGYLPKSPYQCPAVLCDRCYEDRVRRETRTSTASALERCYRPLPTPRKRPAVSTIVRRCREAGAVVAALLLLIGCDSPGLTIEKSREWVEIPQPVVLAADVLGQPTARIVPCLYQADPPAPEPAPQPIIEAEPAIVVVLPERTVAGFAQTIRVQTRGIPAALPIRWKLPAVSVQVGDSTVNFADECRVSEKGRVLHFAWPVAGPLVFRATAGIAVRDAGEVIGFDVLETEVTFTQTGLGPAPPVPPTPPGPGPTPPTPDTAGLSVLIVEEAQDRDDLPAEQQQALVSVEAGPLRLWLDAHCEKQGGQPNWRLFDDDAPTDRVSPFWREALAMPRQSLPWLIATNGKTAGVSQALPKTEAELLAVLESVGGGQ